MSLWLAGRMMDVGQCLFMKVKMLTILEAALSVLRQEHTEIILINYHTSAKRWISYFLTIRLICWDEPGTTANTVGTILRCKDAKAVERQEEHKLKAVAFDCLMWNGEDLTNTPYVNRVNKFLFNINGGINLYPTTFFSDNFAEAADDIIGHGGEGVVIQRKDATYTPGLRSAWKTLKLKQQLPEMELRVLGVIEPNKLYEGISGDNWPYILNGEKVTKPYYMGWKTGVTVDYNGVEVGVTSGTTDEDKEWLASDEAAELIKAGKLIAVVKGMAENSQGSIRHPILIRLRNDLS